MKLYCQKGTEEISNLKLIAAAEKETLRKEIKEKNEELKLLKEEVSRLRGESSKVGYD